MTIKWNRETLLVTLALIMISFGLFYFGNQYFIDPVKEEADRLTMLVNAQGTVLADYPPRDELLNEYELNYAMTESYLPFGDNANGAMVSLEQLASREDVSITSVSRLSDQETVENIPESFVKNSYQAEMSSESRENFRQLLDQLMNEERVWNLTAFSYEKTGESNYSGTFTFELFYYSEAIE